MDMIITTTKMNMIITNIKLGAIVTIITIILGILLYSLLNILSKKGAFNPVKEYMIMERKENFRMIFYPIITALFVFWLIIGFGCWYLWGGIKWKNIQLNLMNFQNSVSIVPIYDVTRYICLETMIICVHIILFIYTKI